MTARLLRLALGGGGSSSSGGGSGGGSGGERKALVCCGGGRAHVQGQIETLPQGGPSTAVGGARGPAPFGGVRARSSRSVPSLSPRGGAETGTGAGRLVGSDSASSPGRAGRGGGRRAARRSRSLAASRASPADLRAGKPVLRSACHRDGKRASPMRHNRGRREAGALRLTHHFAHCRDGAAGM